MTDLIQEIPAKFENMKEAVQEALRKAYGWHIFLSVLLITGGILAIILPGVTALSISIILGVILLAGGIFRALACCRAKMHWLALLSAIFSITAGTLLLWKPLVGTIALATLVGIFLTAEGIFEIFLAWRHRTAKNWGWLMVSGILALILGVMVLAGWPGLTVQFLGVFVGVNLLMYGFGMLILAESVRSTA